MTEIMELREQSNAGRLWVVNCNHAAASDEGEGTDAQPFRSISRAAQSARPGDTVLIRGGIYRERIAPERGGEPGKPITYAASLGETVVVKGSEVWAPDWKQSEDAPNGSGANVWSGALDAEIFGAFHPFRVQAGGLPGHKTLGQVFVSGELLTEVETPEELKTRAGTWLYEPAGETLALHFPFGLTPETAVVEITVRNRIFAPRVRGLGYIAIRGFTFEHCANQMAGGFWEAGGTQAGAVSCRAGHHWTIEQNAIRLARTIGLDCGGEGGLERAEGPELGADRVGWHLIRHNDISDNGECGITGLGHTGTKILHNRIERNNSQGFNTAEEAGVKFHYFYDGLIEGNLVRDNEGHGIWLDNVWYGSRITRNVVLNNMFSGVFIEMGDGPCLVDCNFIGGTRQGEGIYTHDSSGVTIAHNLLFANSHFGITMRVVTDRDALAADGTEKTVGCSRQQIRNNLFLDNYRGNLCLPLPSERARDNVSDYNLFLNGTQWHWEGMSEAVFALNYSNGAGDANPERFQSTWQSAALTSPEKASDFAPESDVSPSPLNLNQWRALTGCDIHSEAPAIRKGEIVNGAMAQGSVTVSARGRFIAFREADALRLLACPEVAGAASDLFLPTASNSGAGSALHPGPFQQIAEGQNAFLLWPLPERE